MDVSPPRYGCSCRPSFWNIVRNMGHSQAISDGDLQWLRLYTQPIFISHQCYIYKRCLTTFICCGCAYWHVPTTLWLLMPVYLPECCQKYGLLPGNKWWWNAVIEAAHPTHIHLISMLYIYKVFDNLYMLWMCILTCSHHAMVAHADLPFWNFARNVGYSQAISNGEMQWLRLHTQPIFISYQCYIYIRCLTTFICCGCAYGCVPTTLWLLMPTKLLEFCQKYGLLPGNKWWGNAVLEAAHPTHIHLTSMLYI
jgi:hypothetical protein